MVVRSRHDGEVEAVGEAEDAATIDGGLLEAAGTGIRELDGGDARANGAAATGVDAGERLRDRVNHHRRCAVAARDASVDAQADHMLPVGTVLDPRQHDDVAPPRGVAPHDGTRGSQAIVVRDVGGVEPGRAMPGSIGLGGEAPAPVVGRIGVTVEVDDDGARRRFRRQAKTRHRTRQDGCGRIKGREHGKRDSDDGDHTTGRAHVPLRRRTPAGTPLPVPPRSSDQEHAEDQARTEGDVLSDGEDAERVEQGSQRRQCQVGARQMQRDVRRWHARFGIHKR